MDKQNGGRPRRMSRKWWKDTLMLIGIAGIAYLAMWFFKKEYLGQGQGDCVISVCYLTLFVAVILFGIHLWYPGECRRILAMLVTALVNHNREAVPPKEIRDQLGVDGDVIDKKLVKVANTEVTICSEQKASKSDFSLEILRKVAPQMTSLEDFFDEVEKTGAKRYYPILRRLIKDEDKSISSICRIMYEFVSDMDKLSYDTDDPTYRKDNLKWLIECEEIDDKWRFYCRYIDICYRDEEYDRIVECAHGAINCTSDEDSKCGARRAYVYILLASIYLERSQYNYAIPYFEEVLKISKIRVPALYRLAYIYYKVLCDYRKGLYYAQLCCLELSDFDDADVGNQMECNLMNWIAYCSAACGEYAQGCTTLENYLASASGKCSKDEMNCVESCLTYLLIKVGKLDEAYSLSKKVLSYDPRDITAVNVKGMCEMRLGHYDIAINCFVSIIPEFKKEKTRQAKYYLGEIYNNLAICEARLGQKSDADEHFRAAFSCDYPNVDVSQFAKIATGPLGLENKKDGKDKSV